MAFVHIYTHPDLSFQKAQSVISVVNDFLGDGDKDIYIGVSTELKYKSDMITFGIMLGATEQRN